MNSHVVLYWYLQALRAKAQGRWLAYELFRAWHREELGLEPSL